MGNFFQELRRRNVVRVVGAYLVVGWVLMQIATGLEESLQLPEWFDGVVVGFLLVGLPIAIILSWVFDLTPEGIVRTGKDTGEPNKEAGRKLDYVIVAGIVVVGAVFAWNLLGTPETVVADASTMDAPAKAYAASIAVLPFADLSPAGDQEYFSDGISEEILNLLAGIAELNVTSRTSAFQFKGRGLGIPEIAANLKVRHIVEGSVRKAGGTIRITAQLIDAAEDRHLWSNTFDRPLTTENIFAIQDEISAAIVAALGDALGFDTTPNVSVQRSTNNLPAYESFLKARPLVQGRFELDTADSLLANAVGQDPNFARAWEMRAAVQLLMWDYGYTEMSRVEANRLTVEFADRALALEPNSATAIAAKVHIQVKDFDFVPDDLDYASVLAEYSRALEIDPRNDYALNWRGIVKYDLGYLKSAADDFSRCVEFEPLNSPCAENLYFVLSDLGQDQKAIAVYNDVLNNGLLKNEYAPLSLLARLGNEEAFKSATNSRKLLFGWRDHDKLYRAYRNPGDDHSQLRESIRDYVESHSGLNINDFADLLTGIGGTEYLINTSTLWQPSLQQFRQSSEFHEMVRQRHMLYYWQQQGFPPQCHAVGEDDFACD